MWASGLSKSEFASRIGTSASRLSTYLSGSVTPSASLLLRMQTVSQRERDEGRQEVSHLCGAGFECSDLTLPVVQPSTYGCPHVLVLSIGDACERQQLMSRRVIYLECRQYLCDVDDARQQTTGLNAAHLALTHATPSGKPVTRQTRRCAQVVQRARQVLAVSPCTFGVEFHPSRVTQSSVNGSACCRANRFHPTYGAGSISSRSSRPNWMPSES